MTLKVLSLFIYLGLHLFSLLSARFERAMMETGKKQKNGMMKKAVSVWESERGLCKDSQQATERQSERKRERKQVTTWKRHSLNHHWLAWLLSVTTLLFPLSAWPGLPAANSSSSAGARGDREREERQRRGVEVKGKKRKNRKEGDMSDWWRKWGRKAKTIDWIH